MYHPVSARLAHRTVDLAFFHAEHRLAKILRDIVGHADGGQFAAVGLGGDVVGSSSTILWKSAPARSSFKSLSGFGLGFFFGKSFLNRLAGQRRAGIGRRIGAAEGDLDAGSP